MNREIVALELREAVRAQQTIIHERRCNPLTLPLIRSLLCIIPIATLVLIVLVTVIAL